MPPPSREKSPREEKEHVPSSVHITEATIPLDQQMRLMYSSGQEVAWSLHTPLLVICTLFLHTDNFNMYRHMEKKKNIKFKVFFFSM